MLREEDNLLESYKELEANKGAVLKAAKTLEDGERILVSKKLFDYLAAEPGIEAGNGAGELAYKTRKTIVFVLDVEHRLGERHFKIPTP